MVKKARKKDNYEGVFFTQKRNVLSFKGEYRNSHQLIVNRELNLVHKVFCENIDKHCLFLEIRLF